jgi:MFS family permease
MFVFGISGAVFNPAMGAAIPDIVPRSRLTTANAMMQGSAAVTGTLGQASGGFLYALLGAPALFLANAVSYFVSASTEAFIRIPQKMPDAPLRLGGLYERFKQDTWTGLKYVWSKPGLRALLLVAAVLNFFMTPISIAMPIFVRDFLGRDVEFLGLLGASQGVGAIVGFILTGTFPVPARLRSPVVVAGMILEGAVLILVAWLRQPYVSLLLFGVMGLMMPVMNVTFSTVIQGTTPSEIRGRVVSVLATVVVALMPVSMGLGGVVIDLIDQDIPLLWYACGAVVALAAARLIASPDFRRFMASDLSATDRALDASSRPE